MELCTSNILSYNGYEATLLMFVCFSCSLLISSCTASLHCPSLPPLPFYCLPPFADPSPSLSPPLLSPAFLTWLYCLSSCSCTKCLSFSYSSLRICCSSFSKRNFSSCSHLRRFLDFLLSNSCILVIITLDFLVVKPA